MAEKIQRSLPGLTTDEEFVERETYLNCLEYASGLLDQLECCFIELGSRKVLARFVSVCRHAAKCSLGIRIQTLYEALKDVLLIANLSTGGKYTDLEERIFSRAARDARPPKKHTHQAYLIPGFDPEFMRISHTEQLDEIICVAADVMDCLD